LDVEGLLGVVLVELDLVHFVVLHGVLDFQMGQFNQVRDLL